MPLTPDRYPGSRTEEEIQLTEDTVDPSSEGAIRYVSGAFRMQDSTGVFDPRSGGGGITEAQHRVLRQLIHFIDEGPAEGFTSGAYKETTPTASPFPTSIIWYESSAKTKKIVEQAISWTGALPTTVAWSIYDTDGSTLLATVSDTISYSGVFESTRTRTITVY